MVAQPGGCLNCSLFPADQDMLPVMPTPEVLKQVEALSVQYPELTERARKGRTPWPRGFQLVVGSGQAACAPLPATATQASGVPRLGAGAQATGVPPLAMACRAVVLHRSTVVQS